MRKLLLFMVVMVMTSIGASAAQTRTANDAGKLLTVARDDQGRSASVIAVAPQPVDRVAHGDFTADMLWHADPWALLGGSGAYKDCQPEVTKGTCYLRCKCGYDENIRKCGETVSCRERAQLEKDACDGHCITDY
jgi:hypothetical protein